MTVNVEELKSRITERTLVKALSCIEQCFRTYMINKDERQILQGGGMQVFVNNLFDLKIDVKHCKKNEVAFVDENGDTKILLNC